MSPDAIQLADFVYESALGLAGLWLLWSLALSPAARARAKSVRLEAWPISASNFLLFLWLVMCGGLGLSFAAGQLLRNHTLSGDSKTIMAAAAFQLGLLAGAGAFFRWFCPKVGPPPPAAPNRWPAGAATFLVSLPLLAAVSFVWLNLLDWCGYPLEQQPLVELMGRTGPPAQRVILAVFAVVVAPVTEELVFRAGIFRYLRTRIPRWAALVLAAELFAAAHADLPSFAPLFVLGLVFSLAYERTGRIGTTMVAHALFNLNTTVLVLSGVNG